MRTLSHLLVICLLAASIAGCDQVKQKIADAINPPTPALMAARVTDLTSQSKTKEAIETGEAFVFSGKDPEGLVAQAVVKAYLQNGDAEGAVAFMQKAPAPKNDSSKSTETVGAPNANRDAKTDSQISQDPATTQLQAGNASVTETPSGTVIRAGDAVVIMPK